MNFFIKAIKNGGSYYAEYAGMTQDTVLALLNDLGCTDITFISKEEYELLTKEK